jgi:hypothetical protein
VIIWTVRHKDQVTYKGVKHQAGCYQVTATSVTEDYGTAPHCQKKKEE